MKTFLSIIFTACFLAIFWNSQNVSAQNFKDEFSEIQISVSEEGSASVTAKVKIKNNDKISLIDGYTLVLPFSVNNIDGLKAKLDDQTVKIKSADNISNAVGNVNIEFEGKYIRPGQEKELVLTGKFSDFTQNYGSMKIVKLTSVKDTFDSGLISFEGDWGKPIIKSIDNEDGQIEDLSRISLTNVNNLFLVFGSSYQINVNSSFVLQSSGSGTQNYLWTVIPEINDLQKVEYSTIDNSNFGLKSTLENTNYAVTRVANKEVRVGFKANVFREGNILQINSSSSDFLPQDLSNTILEEFNALDQNAEENSVRNRIDQFNTLLQGLNVTKPTTSFDNLEEYFSNLGSSNELSQFDLNLLLAQFANQNGLKNSIQYGYVVVDPLLREELQPHFWNLIEIDNQVYLFDPSFEKFTGYNYSFLETDIDRLIFGEFKNSKSNNYLGLINSNNSVHPLIISEFLDKSDNEPQVAGLSNISFEVLNPESFQYSGLIFDLEFEVFNGSNEIVEIAEITGNKFGYLGNYGPTEQFNYLFLPKTTNSIELRGFRLENFLQKGIIEDEITFNFSNGESASNSVSLKFQTRNEFVIVFIIIVDIILVIAGFLIWRRFKRKRQYY